MGRWNGEREGVRPKTCQEKGKGAQFSQGDQMKCVKIIPNTLLRGIERDYSVVAATWALAAASLASLVEGGKPHLCQEVGRRLPVCLGMGKAESKHCRKEGGGGGGRRMEKNFPFSPYPDLLALQEVFSLFPSQVIIHI